MAYPIEFQIYEVIGNLLQENIKDIKPYRDNSRFVFPTFANNVSQLPQITVQLGEPTIDKASAGDFFEDEALTNGDYKVYYYRKSTYPVHIYSVTSKEGNIEVKDLNEVYFLDGKKLNIYWQNLVKQCLYKNLDTLKSYFLNFDISNISPAFDNNTYSWASDIVCQVIVRDKWVQEYNKGELIAEYSLTEDITT